MSGSCDALVTLVGGAIIVEHQQSKPMLLSGRDSSRAERLNRSGSAVAPGMDFSDFLTGTYHARAPSAPGVARTDVIEIAACRRRP